MTVPTGGPPAWMIALQWIARCALLLVLILAILFPDPADMWGICGAVLGLVSLEISISTLKKKQR